MFAVVTFGMHAEPLETLEYTTVFRVHVDLLQVLASHAGSNIDITRKDIACMRSGQWLNDEVRIVPCILRGLHALSMAAQKQDIDKCVIHAV